MHILGVRLQNPHTLLTTNLYCSYISWQTSRMGWIVENEFSENLINFSHFVLISGPLSYLLALYQIFIRDI